MPPPDQWQLDIVTVAVVIITAIAGGQVAQVAGPYAVIVGAAFVGAAFAVMRRPNYGIGRTLAFVGVVTGASVLITGTASVVMAALLGKMGIELQAYYLLAPISLIIAGVGPDWPAVAEWAVSLLRRRIERKAGGGQS